MHLIDADSETTYRKQETNLLYDDRFSNVVRYLNLCSVLTVVRPADVYRPILSFV